MFTLCLCLKTIHVRAQDSGFSNPATSVLNQTLGTINSTNSQTDPKKTGPKYAEYQSICRNNEYDLILYYPDDLKQKRINLLKEKIKGSDDASIKISLRLLKEYLDQNEFAKFKELSVSLQEKKLSNSDTLFLSALQSIVDKNYGVARTSLTNLSVSDPKNIEYLKLLAEVYNKLGNYSESAIIYEDLNKIANNTFLIQQCESLILNSLNADGEKVCKAAAQKFPDNPLPHVFLGISYRERLNLQDAIDSFKKALSIKPTEFGAVCLAETFFIKENFDEAAKHFEEAVKTYSKSIRALMGLAWTNIKNKKYDNAITAFKKACAVNSKYSIDLKRAYKDLSAKKIPEAKKFLEASDTCGKTLK